MRSEARGLNCRRVRMPVGQLAFGVLSTRRLWQMMTGTQWISVGHTLIRVAKLYTRRVVPGMDETSTNAFADSQGRLGGVCGF